MGIPNVFHTGRSGMMAAQAAIATGGHNITNANVEGYSRQRVDQTTGPTQSAGSKALIGSGTLIDRVGRINDEYLEKQIRNAGADLAHMEEKDMALKQTEDIFNEMGGEGLNRLMSKFFNAFRQLSNDPDNEALRQSVREASKAMTNDFKRLRKDVEDVRKHIDSRIEGHSREINALAEELKDLNIRIKTQSISGASPNDMLDRRDLVVKKLASFMNVSSHKDGEGNVVLDIRGVGPLVAGPSVEKFSVERTPADDQGKPEGALDLKSSSSAKGVVTHQIKGGKLGALLEVRDHTLSTIIDKLDSLAFEVGNAVNDVHRQGFTRMGAQGVDFFKPMVQRERAAEFIDLSEDIKNNVNNIASAAIPDAPGDNRIALALANLQNRHVMSENRSSIDDFYNSIISDVGILANSNRSAMNQTKDISTQLGRMREQISGVSIDEETANILQFQHMLGASAKVIQVANECLDTVMSIKK